MVGDFFGFVDLELVNALAPKGRVVVNEADWLVFPAVGQRPQQFKTGSAGAVNEYALARIQARHGDVRDTLQHPAGQLPREPDKTGAEKSINDNHRTRHAGQANQIQAKRPDKDGKKYGDVNPPGGFLLEIARNELVQAAGIERDYADHRRKDKQQ